jgi:hypothetical protein
VCVSLGLKKLRDFTVSEGHRYPLVIKKHEYKLVKGEQNWNVEHPKGIEAFERDDHWPPIIIAQDGLE